jgi:DNA-binding MarR family transcriptional regulator
LVDQRDAGIGELAEQLGCRPTEITRAGRRLTMRGLVRTYRAGRPEQTMMEITPSGLATVRTLLTDRPVHDNPNRAGESTIKP